VRVNERSGGRRLVVFPPWLLTAKVRRQVEALVPSYYFRRLRMYFDRFGCVRCERKLVRYAGSGLCEHCMELLRTRLERIDEKMAAVKGPDRRAPVKAFLRRRETARALLADFRNAD